MKIHYNLSENHILEMLHDMKANYGRLVMRAINYVLDDREAFKVFLTNGMVEIHNIAIYPNFSFIPTFQSR